VIPLESSGGAVIGAGAVDVPAQAAEAEDGLPAAWPRRASAVAVANALGEENVPR